MHPITEKIKKLRLEQYKISIEILYIQNSCIHDWKFMFSEKINDSYDSGVGFPEPKIDHFECSICEAKKTEE